MAVYRGVPWRFVFTDLFGAVTTWAEGLMTQRSIALTLNQASSFSAVLWPDDRRVNAISQIDGYPLVAQSNRLVYGFRREKPLTGAPWVCRFAGILMQPEDQANAEVSTTHITAFDPWKYLEGRRFVNAVGAPPTSNGFHPVASGLLTGDSIATAALKWTIDANPSALLGNGTGIDAGASFGGTIFYGTTPGVPSVIETTTDIVFDIPQGTMVSDVWQQLCDAGNLDIVLRPIYDPINRPGYTHELSIYNLAGVDRFTSVFDWDVLRHNVNQPDRAHDATPGAFFNQLVYFTGLGGGAIGDPNTPGIPFEPSPANVATFGPYFTVQAVPSILTTDPTAPLIFAFMEQYATMAKQGKRTFTMQPIPERSPVPLVDYELGDRVPVLSTNALRVVSGGLQRVQGIPITITDDGIEEIQGLLCSPDYRTISFS